MRMKATALSRVEPRFDIKTVSGAELNSLSTSADSEYIVIDLGKINDRHTDFDETIKVAMNAAVNAVIASMGIKAPSEETDKTSLLMEEAKSVDRDDIHPDRAQRMREQLNARILADSVWLSAKDLSVKAQFSNTNPSAGPNRWKAAGRIFALQINGKDKYPEYALDEGYRPMPIVKQVIALFGEKKTPWGLAIWFGSANGWLGGKKPKDVLKTMPKQVLQAAQAEIDGGIHG
ncbi:integrase [Salmonella enterica]